MTTPVHITIPEPCHENWQEMTPQQQGRFCGSCQKMVVDFSTMSNQEILQHISKASAGVCGRFTNDQLDKTYQEPVVNKVKGWRYAWNMAAAAFLLTANAATAQDRQFIKGKPAMTRVDEKKPVKKPEQQQEKKPVKKVTAKKLAVKKDDPALLRHNYIVGEIAELPRIALGSVRTALSGTITDISTGKPVAYATVRLKEQETGVSADSAGKYTIPKSIYTNDQVMVISAIGYGTQEIEVDPKTDSELQIQLKPLADELKKVEVIAFSASRQTVCTSEVRYVTAGMVISKVRVTKAEKVQRQWDDWMGKKDVKVYPNPVVPGNPLNINLNIKQAGDYRLELLDAGGKLIHAQQVQEVQKVQTLQVPTNAAWSKGIYWLRLTSPVSKKVYNAKVVIQ